MEQKNLGSFIWSVAELLRGDSKQSEYGLVILPFTVLRRFECVLEPTRDAVLKKHAEISSMDIALELVLPGVSDQQFYNTSRYQLNNLGVADTLANLEDYINKFSANARHVFEQFEFSNKLLRLEEDKLLYKVAQHFATIDLHPDSVSNHEMGLAFEHLIRTFAESARGDKGRFGTGLPRVSDGSLLFLMHLISKMKTDGQSRIGIVLNGSPLFTGGAGTSYSSSMPPVKPSGLPCAKAWVANAASCPNRASPGLPASMLLSRRANRARYSTQQTSVTAALQSSGHCS